MDNNRQPDPQVNIPSQPVVTPAPAQPQSQSQTQWPAGSAPQNAGQPEKHSNKLVLFLILGLVLIGIIVGGVYLYMNNKQVAELKKEEGAIQTLPVTTPKPSEPSLDSQLSDINVATDESDFTQVDQDLSGL